MQRLPDRRAPRGTLWSRIALPPLGTKDQRDFADYFTRQTILSLRITMPVTCVIQLPMLLNEANIFPDQLNILILYHSSVVLGCITLFFLTTLSNTTRILPNFALFVWFLSALLVSITACALNQGIYLYIGSIIFTVFYVCNFVRSTFLKSFLGCAGLFPIMNLVMYFYEKDKIAYIYCNFFAAYAVIMGLSTCYFIERLERNKFLLQRRIEREKAQSDDLATWLRQLAMFLRHEVRQPIAQINSSIELSALKRSDDPTRNEHLRDAMNAAQHIWHLIERASRATDAEAFVRQAQPERIEVRGQLQELVQSFSQTYSGVTFALSSSPLVHVRADPVLFKEAVSNLLSNAASFAEEDTVVQISLQLGDDQVQIAVRNEGPLIEGDADTLFQAFSSSRSGAANEHHGLGLYLVRLIAQQHGGTATINNIASGTGVEASLRFQVAP